MDCKKCHLLCFLLIFIVFQIKLLYASQEKADDNENEPRSFGHSTVSQHSEQIKDSEEVIPPFFYLSECQRKAEYAQETSDTSDSSNIECKEVETQFTNGLKEISAHAEPVDYKYEPSLELPHCPQENTRRRMIIVSTLDGSVTGLDYKNGKVLWSHNTGGSSLLSSSMSKLEVTSRGEWVKLIPSLDGGIFRFDGDNVEALPVTAEALLHSSFKFNEDTIFTGGRSSEVIGIAPDSGVLKYACNADGCHYEQSTIQSPNTLIIKHISQSVRAIDPRNGNERWNFSVGLHEVNIAGGGCESSLNDNESEDEYNQNKPLHFILPDGIIRRLSKDHSLEWQQKLTSPIVDAWELMEGNLEKIDLFSSAFVPALLPNSKHDSVSKDAAIYVGVNDKQLYIQKNIKFSKNTLPPYFSSNSATKEVSFPKVQWQPYLATALSRTPVVHHHSPKGNPLLLNSDNSPSSSDLLIRDKIDYPYDNGYYLFGDGMFNVNENDSLNTILRSDDEPYVNSEESFVTRFQNRFWHMVYFGWDDWWQMTFFLTLYIIAQLLVIRVFYIFLRRRVLRKAVLLINVTLHNIFRENQQVLLVLQRIGLNLQQLPAPPPPEVPPLPSKTTESQLASNSSNSLDSQKSETTFFSRYHSDFEPIRCLGKGGFGVVYHVRNKLDENEYAIKRIVLPLKESSANRVKREVRALARLNHSNIVRYYNSWLETPPSGWKDDLNLKFSCDPSSFLSSPDNEDLDSKPSKIISSQQSFDPLCDSKISLDLESPKVNFSLNSNIAQSTSGNFSHFDISASSRDIEQSKSESDASYSNFSASHYVKSTQNDDSFDIVFENSASSSPNNPFVDSDKRIPPSSHSVEIGVEEKGEKYCDNNSLIGVKNLNKFDLKVLPLGSDSPLRPKELELNIPRTFLYIQMELCKKESLKEWLSNDHQREQAQVLSIFNDIVHAVEYVHDRQLIHRDLKPSNIFFSLDGQVKIGDFGLVTTIEDESHIATESPLEAGQQRCVASNRPPQRTNEVGTRLYMSPEQIFGLTYDYKIDIFSLGLIFYEMLVTFGTEMERRSVLLRVREQNLDESFKNMLPDETNLLLSMLHPQPVKRPTTRGIRASTPLSYLQKDLASIDPEEFYVLNKRRHRSNPSDSHSESSTSMNNSGIS